MLSPMGFRIRKSIKVAPGIRMTVTPKGVTTRVGGRKAGVSFGRRGTRVSASIVPGVSVSERIGGGRRKGAQSSEPRPSIREQWAALTDKQRETAKVNLVVWGSIPVFWVGWEILKSIYHIP